MKQFFTYSDILNFKAYTEATDKQTKDLIYTKHLYPFIDYQINALMKQMNTGKSNIITANYEDIAQDLHLHIYTKVLQTIDVVKIQAIQNYLYLSVKNKLINILQSYNSRTNIKIDYNDYNLEEEALIENDELNHDSIILLINNKIDEKINEQVNVNCVAFVYLRLLKDYIIYNDYDTEGFDLYCMKKMKIQKSQYLNLSHSLGFRTIAFKTKKTK